VLPYGHCDLWVHLHNPMYSLLHNLSVLDISSITIPKNLVNLLSRRNTMSLEGYITQSSSGCFLPPVWLGRHSFLFHWGIYHYMAISKPLHYVTIMIRGHSLPSTWLLGGGLFHSIMKISLLVLILFCGPNIVDGFYCDVSHALNLPDPAPLLLSYR
jgi:hypothetical protein